MLDWFDYHGHMCIAFEMLGLSVFDFLVSFWANLGFQAVLAVPKCPESNKIPSFPFFREKTTMSHIQWIMCDIYLTNYAIQLNFYMTTS